MKSFAYLLVVLMAAISGPVFSEESVFPTEKISEAAILSQVRENHTIARPMGLGLSDLLNPLNQKTRNIYFYHAPATNPVIAPFSFLAEVDIYDLTASSSGGGSVSPASASVLSGGSQIFTATPDAGYEVDKWDLDSMEIQNGGTTYTISDVQADHRIYVTFRQAQYTIIATSGPNGSINPSFSMISPGGDEQHVAIPNTGYTVDSWYLNGDLAKIGGTNFKLTNIQLTNAQTDHTIHVTFRKALAYSLDEIEFEDEEEFENRIISNNTTSDELDKALVLIEQVGFGPDPDNAAMGMRSQMDLDPTSPNYGRLVNARAKGIFIKTDADKILIRFKYLFLTSEPGVELVVYVSDLPELLAPDDPLRQEGCTAFASAFPSARLGR